jgi:hypothetical protein
MRRWVTLALALAVVPGAPTAWAQARRASSIDAMWQAANRPYKQALQATSLQKPVEAARSLSAFRSAWQQFRGAFTQAPPRPYLADPQWRADLAVVSGWIEAAGRQIGSADLSGAHETLEHVRQRWLSLRARNGVDYFGDHLVRYHTPMEKISLAVKGKSVGTTTDKDVEAVRVALPDLVARWEAVTRARARLRPGAQGAHLDELMAAESAAVTGLGRSVAGGDRAGIVSSAAKLKPVFAKLYMEFG